MKYLLFLALLIFSASPSYGQVQAKIVADKQVNPGDLVVLDGSHSTNAVHYVWKLLNSDKKFLVFENNTKLITAIGSPGQYRFLLIVVGEDNNKRISVDDAEWTVNVGNSPDIPDIVPNPTPTPTPVPTPTPTPTPNVPTDQFDNLGQGIVSWASEYLKADGRLVASKVGDNFIKTADELTNGVTLLKDSFSKTAEENKKVYPNQSVHDQYTLVGSRIGERYMQFQEELDRDSMVEFLKVIGNAFKSVK